MQKGPQHIKPFKENELGKYDYKPMSHTFWNIPSMPGMLAACRGLGFTICTAGPRMHQCMINIININVRSQLP